MKRFQVAPRAFFLLVRSAVAYTGLPCKKVSLDLGRYAAFSCGSPWELPALDREKKNFRLNAFTVLTTVFVAFSMSSAAMDVSGIKKDEVLQQELMRKISARKKVLLENDVKLRAMFDELEATRKRLNDAVASTPALVQFDAAHREKLKQYGDLEARFNSLKTHWTTHNKAPLATNGLSYGFVKALPGCRFCQQDFDKFRAGDTAVLDGYKHLADQILGQMSVARSGLLSLTVSRSKIVEQAIRNEPKLNALSLEIAKLEQDIQGVYGADKEVASLLSQQILCRERLKNGGSSDSAPIFGSKDGST